MTTTTNCADCDCKGIEIERPGELPKGHEGEEGLCASKWSMRELVCDDCEDLRDAAHAVRDARDLDHLLAAVRNRSELLRNEGDPDALPASQQVDFTDLPTFGGEEPNSIDGVWSWDATRLLVGTHVGQPGEAGAMQIVPRTVECAYCAADVAPRDPAQMDEDDWEKEAEAHEPDCEWIATRAHTRDAK